MVTFVLPMLDTLTLKNIIQLGFRWEDDLQQNLLFENFIQDKNIWNV